MRGVNVQVSESRLGRINVAAARVRRYLVLFFFKFFFSHFKKKGFVEWEGNREVED